MKFVTRAAASILLILATAYAAEADTTLDKYQGIVISPQASPVVRQGAGDLQYHLEKIAGRKFPLVEAAKAPQGGLHFVVGPGVLPDQEAAIDKLPREGWMLRSVPNGLLLAGSKTEIGPFNFYHPVSLFLEKHCGVRWLWPGESGEVIPQNPKLNIPTLNESGVPEVKRRKLDFYYTRFWTQRAKDDLRTWAGRTRQGDQYRAVMGHSWAGTIPPALYFKDHPEWYGMVAGQRVPVQLCVSNMAMRDEFVKRLLVRPDYKDFDIISVSANDGYGFCECSLCKAKGTEEPLPNLGKDYQNAAYWDFVNDIALRIKKLRPDLGIGSLAYTISRTPPKYIAKLPDNVYLSMSTYSTQMMLPEEKAKFQAFFNDWKNKGVKILMREYWGTHYWLDLPLLCPEEIADTIKLGAESGMSGAYGEAGKNFSTMAPNYYVLTHILWNPKASTQQLLDEFYATFGPAAKPVRAYYELMEQEVHKGWNKYQFTGGYSPLVTNYGNIFTPEVMARGSAFLDEAARATGNDTKLRERVAIVRTGCEYTTLMGELLSLYTKLGRTGFPLEAFEWEATVGPRRLFSKTPTHSEGREWWEKWLKEPFTYTLAEKDAWMMRAWDLGQKRIELLNHNRLNFALDEGLYAQTLEAKHTPTAEQGIRRWQQTIGKYLGKPEEEIAELDYTRPGKKE